MSIFWQLKLLKKKLISKCFIWNQKKLLQPNCGKKKFSIDKSSLLNNDTKNNRFKCYTQYLESFLARICIWFSLISYFLLSLFVKETKKANSTLSSFYEIYNLIKICSQISLIKKIWAQI